MSRPRSLSPQSRRPPWNDRGIYKGFAGYSKSRSDWSPALRDEDHRFREGIILEGQRKVSPSPQDHFWRHQDQDGCYRRRPSPRCDAMDRRVPRSFPQRDGGSDADRQRREDMHFGNRCWAPRSSPRFPKDHLAPNSHSDHSKGAPGWRREEWGQGDGRFRDVSPSVRSDEPRESRREKNSEGPHRGRPREDLHQDTSPPWKRPRREMDPQHHSGFRRDNKVFGEQRYSPSFEGDHRGDPPHKEAHRSGPLGFDHNHCNQKSWKPLRHEPLDQGDHDFNQQRHSGPRSSLLEQFRKSNNKPEVNEDSKRRQFAEKGRVDYESKRSPPPQERANIPRFSRRDGPSRCRGRGGPHLARERFSHNHVRHFGSPKCRQNFHQLSRGYRGNARKNQRAGFRPREEAFYSHAVEEEEQQSWTEKDGHLKQTGPPSLDPHLAKDNPGMKQNRPSDGCEDKKSKNMTVVTEETLTIKVDMSRPVHTSSTLCYSSDRQLSLDLVNVGRQRLDFLPSTAETSGSNQDGTVHTGTFAQEIITLVHHVKELYFKGEGITLNKRFSTPQKGGHWEGGVGMTLDQRFSSNHFDSNVSAEPQDNLFPHPTHGPGDLRHDLERRRQQRLDGVTITIPGGGQRGALSTVKFGGDDVMIPEVQDYSWDGNMGSRRGGAPYRMNVGLPQRYRNRQPMRGQNHDNNTGPSW